MTVAAIAIMPITVVVVVAAMMFAPMMMVAPVIMVMAADVHINSRRIGRRRGNGCGTRNQRCGQRQTR